MVILSKACKPDSSEYHNCLKLSHTDIIGLCSSFVDCKSFLVSKYPGILALCEANLDDSINSCNFSVRGYLPFFRKDYSTNMHCLAVDVKEGLPFARDLSLENFAYSYLCFRLAYLTQCLATFSSINHLVRLRARFLIIYHLTQMRFSRSTHMPMFLSLETLISVIKTGLPVLVEVIKLANSVIIFRSQMILLRWLTFLLGFQTVILIVLLF